MKVAVTGATGFVGRHVVAALLTQGIDVVAVARRPQLVFSASEKLSMVSLDLCDTDNPFAKMGHPDILIHLAWGNLPNYKSDTHLEIELPKHVAFLDACIKGGLQRLVATGTCLEYGMQSGRLTEDLPAAPVTAYGKAKDRLRLHLQTRAMQGELEFVWLRLFYLYGPGQAATSLYSQLAAAIAAKEKSFPMSPGDQERDFLPVETAAREICMIALENSAAGIVNLCSGEPRKVYELVKDWLANREVDIKLDRGVLAYPDYEPHSFWGSTEKLDALLREYRHA